MIKLTFILSLVLYLNIAYGQTYISPSINSQTNPRITIDKVELLDNYTIVHFVYTAPKEYTNGGWACVSPDMFIEDIKTGQKYYLVNVKGIPLCSNKHFFKKSGEKLHFKLYFPKINHSVRYINIIENAINGFNFYRIYLQPVA